MLQTNVNLKESNVVAVYENNEGAPNLPPIFVSDEEQIDSYADIIIEILMSHMVGQIEAI